MGIINTLISKLQNAEATVVAEVEKIEGIIVKDLRGAFDKARTDALAANDRVNQLKADLQAALVLARDLHQAAADAAAVAQAEAEADVAKFKAAVAAHTADMNTQGNQVTAQ